MRDHPPFDVFLAHNSFDKEQVRAIAQELRRRNLKPWLDEEQIRPGTSFQQAIQQAIPLVKSAAIFIGIKGLGRWQILELESLIQECVANNISIIPVLLPGVQDIPVHLRFLRLHRQVSFSQRIDDVETLNLLEWGITGQTPPGSENIKQIRFISELQTRLIHDKGVYDLSRNFSDFDFIGFKRNSPIVELVAFKKADGLNERQIVELRDQFFEITQTLPDYFNLKSVNKMPNSLLCFVFEDEFPNYLIDFIKRQIKISHWDRTAVLVSWVIHIKHKQIYTHDNPVSFLPPVFILESSVFPGLEYLKSFLSSYDS